MDKAQIKDLPFKGIVEGMIKDPATKAQTIKALSQVNNEEELAGELQGELTDILGIVSVYQNAIARVTGAQILD